MWMFRPGINLQFAEQISAQGTSRQHAFNGMVEDAFRMLFAHFAYRRIAISAGIVVWRK